jgi:hypothetical protein
LLTVTPAGNVGIGTTSPGAKLTLQDGTFRIGDTAGGSAANFSYSAGKLQIGLDSAGTDGIYFRTYSGGYGDRMIIKNTGNVGIGKTNPGTALDVAGTVTATQFVGGGAGITGITASTVPWSGITGKPNIQPLTGTYGSVDMTNSGSYGGINFATEGVTFMVDGTGASGIYNNSGSWQWYFQSNGALTAGSVPWSLVTGRATPTFTDVYATSWLRNTAANTGLYNEATASHFYSSSAGVWNIAGGSTYPQLIFRDTHAGTIRGYVYSDATGFGMLHSAGGWMFYSPTGNPNVYFPAWGNWISSAATHRGEGTNFIDYSYGLYDAYRGGWRASNDLYVAYAYNAGYAASAGTVSQACVFCLNGSPQCGSTWPNVMGLITGSAHTFYGCGVGCSGSIVAQSGQILLCCK